MALRTSSRRVRQPVEVSLWTTHGLDGVALVLAQALLDLMRVGADAPIGRDDFGLEAEAVRHLLPQHGELAGLDHQHMIAGRQRVGEGCFPGARTGRRINDDRVLGLENGLDAGEHAFAELSKLGAAVVEDLALHGLQDALGHRSGSGNLQKMPARSAWLIRHQLVP